ncbi:DUF4159 domain-containing protein [Myxococcus sp. MISCRS1]|jgi:hypothetical protein|uniref:DUF4159 domain-containing protein n=1 Tax=Myxococcus TaxID=32 RepID=UPI001CC07584|nr:MULTISPECIES: DUF4159 domain-containing protein [Myxococcus]BDT36952.1 DUF4159 domain-containing protein [Myxococcus sp. MH1]MBZ4394507.1 DUF4159 domain-containing protein [Myxococcus sp. AS-1-15]MBZ4409978.1 DUF4159 domain-containing protein [Myxococcus sp. XM-1-1-1]MCK8496972.1 DUF4159 domain-containing protein [Myxococcus fulvus]MCY1001478.1 DUF4159 domain-containing protein [Myxococcus sp. MISCRS1]
MSARRLTRRNLLLGTSALVPLLSGRARAFGEKNRFIPAVAKHGGRWDGRLSGLRRIAWELQRRTSVEVVPDARPFALSSPDLFEYPFLYFGGDGAFPALSEAEVTNLRRYLTYGGFMLADANDGSDGDGFDASFRREMRRVLPQSPLTEVPSTHVVFKSFFMLDAAPGRLLNKPQLLAANLGKRAAVLYSQNDVAGAWSRNETGDYEFDVSPGGEPQRELAVRLGINVCMYALCLDYKDDAVHLQLILNKRR